MSPTVIIKGKAQAGLVKMPALTRRHIKKGTFENDKFLWSLYNSQLIEPAMKRRFKERYGESYWIRTEELQKGMVVTSAPGAFMTIIEIEI